MSWELISNEPVGQRMQTLAQQSRAKDSVTARVPQVFIPPTSIPVICGELAEHGRVKSVYIDSPLPHLDFGHVGKIS
jgi:hypothetical protein